MDLIPFDSPVRKKLLDSIPERYSSWLHFFSTTGIGLVVLVLCCLRIQHPTALELLTVPALFLLANGAEWRAHKSLLHRRTFPFQAIYDQHTPRHHALFQYDTMEIRSKRELYHVLIPSFGVLMIVIATAPFSFLFAKLFSPNSGWLLLAASAIYVVTYELTHLSYHWPSDSRIGRIKLVRAMREHHRRHHHPRLMHWNYNVSFPLFDWIKGTIAPPHIVEEALREKPAARKTADGKSADRAVGV